MAALVAELNDYRQQFYIQPFNLWINTEPLSSGGDAGALSSYLAPGVPLTGY